MERGSKSWSCFKMGYELKGGEIGVIWLSSVHDVKCMYDVAFRAAESRLVGERRCWAK